MVLSLILINPILIKNIIIEYILNVLIWIIYLISKYNSKKRILFKCYLIIKIKLVYSYKNGLIGQKFSLWLYEYHVR